MKRVIPRYRTGQIVHAEVVELISEKAFIANFQGDLIRIVNETKKPLEEQQNIRLRVRSVKPLSFSLL